MSAPRSLPLTVGIALVALGIVAPLSSDSPNRAEAVSPGAVARANPGSKITVAGLVGDVRQFSGGGAATTVDDCRGQTARVYFPPGVPPPPAWTVALVRGAVELYEGERELVAASVAPGFPADQGALQVSAEEIARATLDYTCQLVAFAAPVLSASTPETGAGPQVIIEVAAGNLTLTCVVHLDEPPVVQITPGARVSFVGLPALGDGGRPVVHVRA